MGCERKVNILGGRNYYSQIDTNLLLCVNPDTAIWKQLSIGPQIEGELSNKIAVCSPIPFVFRENKDFTNYLAVSFDDRLKCLRQLPAWVTSPGRYSNLRPVRASLPGLKSEQFVDRN